jgi:hypothetical protein
LGEKGKVVIRGTGRNRLLKSATPPPAPNNWCPKMWAKHYENTRRVERHTGIVPIATESWETVAVCLMDALDRANRELKKRGKSNDG